MQTLEQKQEAMRSRSAVYDGRHRNKQKPLPETATEEEYWEAVLQQEGLNLHQGEKRWLYYWGTSNSVETVYQAEEIHRNSGRPRSKGAAPVM